MKCTKTNMAVFQTVIALSAVLLAPVLFSGQNKDLQNLPLDPPPLARRPPTLLEQAKDRESLTVVGWGDGLSIGSLDDLVRKADVIVEGRIVSANSRISTSGYAVLTDYTVHVKKVMKAPNHSITQEQEMLIHAVGGTVVIQRKRIEVENRDLARLTTNGEYVFFVKKSPQAPDGEYGILVCGIFGIENGTVRCQYRHCKFANGLSDSKESDFLFLLSNKIEHSTE